MITTMDESAVYTKCQKIIRHTAAQFSRTFGYNLEDILSLCDELFVTAIRKYNPDKGTKVETWVRTRLWFGMLDKLRGDTRKRKHLTQQDIEPDEIAEIPSDFNVKILLSDISEKAKKMISEVINPSSGMRSRLEAQGMKKSLKSQYLTALSESLGLSPLEFRKAYNEIREAL